jgi:hypothetical protein
MPNSSHALLLVAALALGGCVREYTIQTPYDPAAAEWSTKDGDATIKGQAFLKTRGGDVKTCAGNKVTLIPSTARQDEIARAIDAGYNKLIGSVPGGGLDWRNTRCDAQGNFVFTKLPAGTWWVEAVVRWEAADSIQGGGVREKVTTRPGDTADVIVTR